MSQSAAPVLPKWPFIAGDAFLLVFAASVIWRTPGPASGWELFTCLLATAAGGWLCAMPFLLEHKAGLRLAEASVLATTVSQMEHLHQIRSELAGATSQWQALREHADQTVTAARDIADRMKAQVKDFCGFLQKTHDAESNHLKLETEKLRKSERDWLQATVLILDHVFALQTAASQSGQPKLIAQMNQFQFACRDAVRRVGLVGFTPSPNDPFNPQVHQLAEGATPKGTARIEEVLALGYTYQGELVRRALVKVRPAEGEGNGPGGEQASPSAEAVDAPPEPEIPTA